MNRLEYYTRQKESWSESELQEIRTEYDSQQLTISQIGDLHRRTPGQIGYALKRIGLVTHNTKVRGYAEYRESELYSEIVSTPKVHKDNIDDSELEHQGAKWEHLEEQQLIHELEIDMNHTTIAKNHGRTTTAIRKRIRHIVYEQYTKGKTKESIANDMKLSEHEVTSIIDRYLTTHKNIQKQKEQQPDSKKIQTIIQPVSSQPVLMIAPPLQAEFTLVKTELAEIKTDMKTIKTEIGALKKMIKHISTLFESVYEIESA